MLQNTKSKNFFQQENEELIPSFNIMNDGISDIKACIQKNQAESILKICTKEVIQDLNTIVLKVHIGRATLDSVPLFNEFLKAELHLVYSHYIIDLSETHFMDSTFLGSIVRLLKQVKAKGGNLSLVINFDQIKILAPFEQLQKILKVYPTLDEAKNNI